MYIEREREKHLCVCVYIYIYTYVYMTQVNLASDWMWWYFDHYDMEGRSLM